MPTTDTQLQQLVINVGTEEQITADIESGTITADQLSLTTNGPEYLTEDDVTDTYLATGEKPVSGKAVAEALTTKQNVLVSGSNIKTINGQSIIGPGNIVVEGGGGGIGDIDDISIRRNNANDLEATGVINQADKTRAVKMWTGTLEEYNALKNKNAWYGWKVNNTKYYTTSALPAAGDQVYNENLQPVNFVVKSATAYQMKIIETAKNGSEV